MELNNYPTPNCFLKGRYDEPHAWHITPCPDPSLKWANGELREILGIPTPFFYEAFDCSAEARIIREKGWSTLNPDEECNALNKTLSFLWKKTLSLLTG